MQMSLALMGQRRFLPLFVTQFLGAMNDNLFKNAMIFFVIYHVLSDPKKEETFSGIATGVFIVPFFLLSALAGQLADAYDKARMIRIVKTAEIGIMTVGAAGLLLPSIPLMLLALFAMGVHSTFFGPIKYAILPQHLAREDVLGGTGLIEAGTYMAILTGTILAGFIDAQVSAFSVVGLAVLGWFAGRYVPPAPPVQRSVVSSGDQSDGAVAVLPRTRIDYNIFRASWTLVSGTMHIRRLFLAIVSISFFWMIGAILFIQFPPLTKNVLMADKSVASLFLAVFSVGVAIGSVAINRLLNGEVSARYAPACVIVMGLFVLAFHFVAGAWTRHHLHPGLLNFWGFVEHPGAPALLACLLGVAIAGGMFVVPLYAFLTTTVDKSETARTVGANNLVNAICMTIGSGVSLFLTWRGMRALDQFLLTAVLCLVSAWLAWKLHRACDVPLEQTADQPTRSAAGRSKLP